MNFTILWLGPASTDLLAHLLRAADKPGTFAAARRIERLLEKNPQEEGEERDEGSRILFMRPFCVLFRVDEPGRTVYIERLKWVGG